MLSEKYKLAATGNPLDEVRLTAEDPFAEEAFAVDEFPTAEELAFACEELISPLDVDGPVELLPQENTTILATTNADKFIFIFAPFYSYYCGKLEIKAADLQLKMRIAQQHANHFIGAGDAFGHLG